MPFHAVSTFGNVRVALWRSDETSEMLLSQAAPVRRAEYEAAIAGMSEHRRCERLAVRLLLERLGVDAAIEYLPSGKPVLRGDSRCISISHTKGWAAAAVADTPVGLDIERKGAAAPAKQRPRPCGNDAVVGKRVAVQTAGRTDSRFRPTPLHRAVPISAGERQRYIRRP